METQARTAQAFYDRISRFYDALADASEHEAREVGLELLSAAAADQVLEIGFGTGHALVDIAEGLDSGGRVHGIDISPGMLAVTRKRLREAGVSESVAQPQLGDATALPFAAGSFTGVFSSFTLELFPEDRIPTVLEEISRVLRPAGRLALVSMYDDGRETPMVDLYRFLHRHFPHIIDCQPIEIPRHLEQAGFEIIERESLSIWGLPVLAVLSRPEGAG